MINKINTFIGVKFYKYNENKDLEIIRVVGIKPNNRFTVIKNNDTLLKCIKTAEQLHEYTMLRPDAIFTFNIVINAEDKEKLQDVVVTMSRKQDKDMPYVVCRQMMQNLFSQIVTTQTILGNCVSQDTCPLDVNFRINFVCSKLVRTFGVNAYLDDTPEDILKFANKIIHQADKVLEEQYQRLHPVYKGLCTSVKQLLEENSFWDDVYKGLKITKLNSKIENSSLSLEQLTYLEQEISYLMDKVDVVEYDHDIDFTKIKSDYMLILDSEKKLYLVSYLRGSFIKQEHLSEEELAKFESIKI
jgi:hypothetical protein